MNIVGPPSTQSTSLAEFCPFHMDVAARRPNTRRTMVLTGASRGIGHATVKLLGTSKNSDLREFVRV